MTSLDIRDFLFEPKQGRDRPDETSRTGEHRRSHTATRRRKHGRFLKGPVPMSWLLTAARLPGRALHVGVLLWHWCGWKRKNEFSFSGQRCADELGVDRSTVHRALRALERANLVKITWAGSKSPIVRLVDPQQGIDDDDQDVETRPDRAADDGASPAGRGGSA